MWRPAPKHQSTASGTDDLRLPPGRFGQLIPAEGSQTSSLMPRKFCISILRMRAMRLQTLDVVIQEITPFVVPRQKELAPIEAQAPVKRALVTGPEIQVTSDPGPDRLLRLRVTTPIAPDRS